MSRKFSFVTQFTQRFAEIENKNIHFKRMLVPFVRVGEVLTGANHFEFSPGGLWEALKGRHSRDLMFGVLHAVRALIQSLL